MRTLIVNASALLFLFFLALNLGCLPPPKSAKQAATDSAKDARNTETETIVAKPGVGKQGQKLAGKEGLFLTPVKGLFKTRQRVVFEIQIPKSMQIYEGLHGHVPKTHEVFMEEIIKKNQIRLPELPEGQKYVYDPDRGELMVQRPRQ